MLGKEDKRINSDTEKSGRTKLGGGGRIDFYLQWGNWKGVRRGEGEGEPHRGWWQDDRPKVNRRENEDKEEKEKQRQEEETETGEVEEELYMSEGEDGNPFIKCRKKSTVN